MTSPEKKIGLALGSGAARGWAHIGVIQALTENGIDIGFISGTSAGALVGGVHAGGKLEILKEIVLQLNKRQLIGFSDPSWLQSGALNGRKIANFIEEHVIDNVFSELNIPFRAVATDLNTGSEVVIDSGSIIDAIRASISIPGIFTPVKRDDAILVDGALVNPLPVSVVREMGAEKVIAVDINDGADVFKKRKVAKKEKILEKAETLIEGHSEDNPLVMSIRKVLGKIEEFDVPAISRTSKWIEEKSLPVFFNVILTSYNIMQVQITQTRLQTYPADVLIRPDLADIGLLDFDCAQDAIDEGYRAAIEQMVLIKSTVK